MGSIVDLETVHPKGEVEKGENRWEGLESSLDTFAGKVQIKWSPGAAVSGLGLMPYFIEFLKRAHTA